MREYFISILILLTFLFAGLISPEEDAILNTTHIKFEWEQVPEAISYRITIEDSVFTNESLILINKSLLWNNSYSWIVQPIYSDGTIGEDIGQRNFSIADSRSNAYANQYNPNQYSEGITIFSSFFDYYSAAIDENGNEIWNTSNNNIVFYNTDYYGQFFGCSLNNSLEHNLPGFEFSLQGEGIWYEPNDDFLHHDLIQLPNGNYMGIIEVIELGPIPIGPWTPLFTVLGYQADGITPEFPWVGDKIVEWDKDTKEIVWEWNTFDYYSMEDYDTYGDTWYQGFYDGRYDWTHINAIDFSENENAIYTSCRHLSRITKIDYETGESIWDMGLEMPSGDVECGQNLGFSFQHSITALENGNILTLDNGNISETINNTPYPTTRALEIIVNENSDGCSASIGWEYELSEELFGFASGNVQKLKNNNYLITTVGDGGTSIEVNPQYETIWEGKYNLSLPNGAVYRANRLSSLYPIAFSIIIPGMNINSSNELELEYNDGNIDIIIYNDGSNDETFCISSTNYCEEILSGNNATISIPHETDFVSFDVIPEHREDLKKNISLTILDMPNCDIGFTYYDLGDIPNSTIVVDGNQCFNNIDLNALDDIISINSLDITNPIGLGTQNWFNGRITRLLIGDYYTGGNILLDTLPDSLGNMENLAILYLDRNNLTQLPDNITNLSNLIYLVLSFNQLTLLPENIGDLSNLIWIDVGYNNLEAIPESIGGLTILSYLWIFNNQLASLPESICNLNINWDGIDNAFLPYFGSGGNQLCNELPECIETSENINTSIDPLYYSFLITVEQDCSESCTLMDLNQDGIINVTDIIAVVNIILDNSNGSEEELCAADINEDGIVNVIDIIAIVNQIIG